MNPSDSTNSSAEALKEPMFIIEYEGALYVTEGVLEYRRSEAQSEEQKRGVEAAYQLYEEGRRSGESYPQAPPVVVDRKGMIAFMATSPPRPPAPPGG